MREMASAGLSLALMPKPPKTPVEKHRRFAGLGLDLGLPNDNPALKMANKDAHRITISTETSVGTVP